MLSLCCLKIITTSTSPFNCCFPFYLFTWSPPSWIIILTSFFFQFSKIFNTVFFVRECFSIHFFYFARYRSAWAFKQFEIARIRITKNEIKILCHNKSDRTVFDVFLVIICYEQWKYGKEVFDHLALNGICMCQFSLFWLIAIKRKSWLLLALKGNGFNSAFYIILPFKMLIFFKKTNCLFRR